MIPSLQEDGNHGCNQTWKSNCYLLPTFKICFILDDDGNDGNDIVDDVDDDGKLNLKADILDPRTGIALPLTGVSIGGQAPDGWR